MSGTPTVDPVGTWSTERRVAPRWSRVGALADPGQTDAVRPAVDPAGLVSPRADGWSLDWWVRSEERWHFPGRERAVRQELTEHAPVTATSMRVPGGDVVQRAGVVRSGGASIVVVEVHNASPVPVALGWALRPLTVAGEGRIGEVVVREDLVEVDGAPVARLQRPPAQVVVASAATESVVTRLLREEGSGVAGEVRVACAHGRAEAVLVLPLPHGLTQRVALALEVTDTAEALPDPAGLPEPRRIATGWSSVVDTGTTRALLPPGRLQEAWEANRRTLLLAAGGPQRFSSGVRPAADEVAHLAEVALALDRVGHHREAGTLLATLAGRETAEATSIAALVVAIGEHDRFADDPVLRGAVLEAVAGMAAALRRACGARGRRGRPRTLPVGPQPPWIGGEGPSYRDGFVTRAALLDAASLFERAGEADAAAAARGDASALDELIGDVFEQEGAPQGSGPARAFDAGAVGNLVAVAPLGLIPATGAGVAQTVDALGALAGPGLLPRPDDPSLMDPGATMRLLLAEVAGLRANAVERLDALLSVAGTGFGWPEALEVGSGQPRGDAHHLPLAAGAVLAIRELLVADRGELLVLHPVFPPAWRGHHLEVHGVPTRAGTLSWALRWHDERPALLWELDLRDGAPEPGIVAPGLDRGWVGRGLRGEALLAPRRAPSAGPERPPEESFG